MDISESHHGHRLLIDRQLIITQQTLAIDDSHVAYELIRSKKRKKSIAMRLRKDGVLQLNVPHLTAVDVIENFIISKYRWLQKKKLENKNQKITPKPTYQNGEKHLYHGVQYTLKIIQSNQSKVVLTQGYIVIYHRKNVSIKNLLDKWYKLQALNYFSNRTHLFANNFNLPKVRTVKVRRMKARWGSCSSDRVITYNVHLIKADPRYSDYVIIHELCHLVHPNHGSQFYRLQTRFNPYWKQQKQRLNQLGYRFIAH